MNLIVRQIISAVCLLPLLCGGQMSVCACEIAPAANAVACESHGDSASAEHHHTHSDEPGADVHCPCAGCHSCSHAPMIVPGVTLSLVTNEFRLTHKVEAPALASCDREVFIPPKV